MINGTEMTKNSGTFGVVVGWVIDLLVISETEKLDPSIPGLKKFFQGIF